MPSLKKQKQTPLTIIIFFLLLFNSSIANTDNINKNCFYKEIEEPIGRNQTQDEVEKFALQKAKRLALEETGSYISSLVVLQNDILTKDEITDIAAGLVKSNIVSNPIVSTRSNISYVKLRIKLCIDSTILKQHVDHFFLNKDKEEVNSKDKLNHEIKNIEQKNQEQKKFNKQKKTNSKSIKDNITNIFICEYTKIQFVYILGDCFQMGCGNWMSDCDEDERPVYKKCLKSFWISKYEITQKQWKKIMNNNPSQFDDNDNKPVDSISWNDIQQFIFKIKMTSGLKYRLPTEAEWEFACRSGGLNEIYAGSKNYQEVAWYRNNSNKTTHPVGLLRANKLGLFDMSGNVWEWCNNAYSINYETISSKRSNNPKVIRGGCWIGGPKSLRCTHRHYSFPNKYYNHTGFRLIKEIDK